MLEDAARAGVDSAESAAIDNAVNLTLDVMAFIPIGREVAAMFRLVGAAKDLAVLAADGISDVIDRFLIRHRASGDRLFELSRQHALNARALPPWRGSANHEPSVEWRSRVIAIIGLLRLIERLGSPHDNVEDFKQKIGRYRIVDYINTYLLAPAPLHTYVDSSTPLDEKWLYAIAVNPDKWSEMVARLHSSVPSADQTFGEESGYRAASFGAYPRFPVERFEASSVIELSRSFALDFSAIVDKRLAWSRVYVRDRSSKKWIHIESASFKIGPQDALRVVAIFRAKSARENLSGVPVTLQLKRMDGLLRPEGPTYTTSLSKTAPECSSDGMDKELLADDPDENKYATDELAYMAVFHPFYFHRKVMYKGLKPFGHIALEADPSYTLALNLMAGKDAARLQHKGKDIRIQVHLNLKNGNEVGMLLNRDFLEQMTADNPLPNLFDFPYQEIAALGVLAFANGKVLVASSKGDEFTLDDERNALKWGKPLTLVAVFGARITATHQWGGEDVRFPAQWRFREPHFWSDEHGPEYPAEVLCLTPGEAVRSWSWKDVVAKLTSKKILAKGDPSDVAALSAQRCKEEMALFATSTTLRYAIESADGKSMLPVEGPKPFGREVDGDNAEYIVGLQMPKQLRAPEDALKSFLTLRMEPLSKVSVEGSAFGAKPTFVTDKRFFRSLEIEKL